MRRSIILLLICFAFHLSQAQVPGYLGMRWMAYGNVQTFFNLTNNNQWNSKPSINLKYKAGIDYVLSKEYSIAAEYECFQTAARYEPKDVISVSSNTSETEFSAMVRTMTVGLTFSWYNRDKGSIAPYGFYQQAGLKYLLCAVTNEFESMNRIRSTFSLDNYQSAVIMYGLGRRWIFFDRLVFHAGFEFGYVIGANPLGMVNISGSKSYLSSDVNYGNTINRLSALYLVNFNIGLGFILF